MRLLAGFTRRRVEVGEVALQAAVAGDGPPVVLLHGFPQTHVAWHAVAPRLAERFTVVCPDLRGYGGSGKPPGDPGHQRYAKRTMAADVRALMAALGHDRFAVVGHDRGALVGHRLALDHPAAVTRLAVLDVLPQLDMWEAMNRDFALAGYHLFFVAQPAGFPERLIGADPELFLTQPWRRLGPAGRDGPAVRPARGVAALGRRGRRPGRGLRALPGRGAPRRRRRRAPAVPLLSAFRG